MHGKTFALPKPQRRLRRLIGVLPKNCSGKCSKRPSARRMRFTGRNLLRHELRTPLAGILGMAELLRDSGLAREQRGLLSALRESGHQMERLIDRTPASGFPTEHYSLRADPEPFNGLRLLEQVIRAHWPAALKKGIDLQLVFDHRLEENWYSDPALLRQLLDNLLANAIKYTDRGHVLLDAHRASPEPGGDADVELCVQDTGIGVAACDGQRIYSIHERGTGGAGRYRDGSGLGLYVCRRVTSLLGGRVRHQPNEDDGTCFKVVLPGLANPLMHTPARLRPALLTSFSCQLRLGRPTCRVVKHVLRRIGAQVTMMRHSRMRRLPDQCDAVICNVSNVSPSIIELKGGSGPDRPVLLSRKYPPADPGSRKELQPSVLELPQPILQSNLEPLLLQIALQRTLRG